MKDHELIEEIEEQEHWWKGPLKVIMSLFLVLLIILMIVPYYGVNLDPEPKQIIGVEEVVSADLLDLNNSIFVENEADYKRAIDGNDPQIKLIADKIVSRACNGNIVCQSKAIFYFVRDKLDYISDPPNEYVKDAKTTLISGGGDCDDSSVLLSSLLQAIGVNTRLVFVPGHVYVQAWIPKVMKKYKAIDNWVNLDATCSYCGFGESSYKYTDSRKRYLE